MGLKLGNTYRIIKLGGSLITNKNMPYSFNEVTVKRIAREVKQFYPLIIIHGGGSFGHYEASRGDKIRTVIAMQELNLKISKIFYDEEVNVFPLPGRFFSVDIVKRYLNEGLVPLIYGDITESGKIISGDDIAVLLGKAFNARVLFASDVDGVFINGKVAREVNSSLIDELSSSKFDVTGGMKSKIQKILENCIEALIFNGKIEGNIFKALQGKDIGTIVRCKNDNK
ncbi:isopentenyl phosphate kinase [Acidianus sp. HS-5]|uniref:isopentenyl phosphate kinase n=1 Tax=Acidianus sp. HS-5 TaxID=2886040 RepID=UPI001EEF000B|nr:isopentenyl phosphate kinase [Acidianus sp. HS-5]BDC19138.1 acetylglutamate kinase [Acidianus sp. HS-5]